MSPTVRGLGVDLAVHERGRSGAVEAEFVNTTWQRLYAQLCGDAVRVLPEHRYDWARIGHIFFKPFYCYNYSLSAVASLACYAKYRAEGQAFVPAYLALLRSGSAHSPVETLKAISIDLADRATIDGALDYIAGLIEELKQAAVR